MIENATFKKISVGRDEGGVEQREDQLQCQQRELDRPCRCFLGLRIARLQLELLAAGERAIASSAHREGTRHLETGLELIQQLSTGPLRTPLELSLLTKLGAAASVLKGYSAPEGARPGT